MEPGNSLQHSQEPATSPCPEPEKSSPYPSVPLHKDPFSNHHPIYTYVFQVASFPHVFPQNPLCTFPLTYTCCLSHSS